MKKKMRIIIIAVAMTLLVSLSLSACVLGSGSDTVVESVSISGSDTVAVNEEATYEATVNPADAYYNGITWAISGENTVGATISSEGLFKATSAGTVKISATAGGKTGEKTITVQFIEATALSVSNVSATSGSSVTLFATLTPSNASNSVVFELVDNTIGAILTGNQVSCGNLGTVNYKAKIGSLESNTATITFTLDPANGETITTAEQLNAIRNNLGGKFQLGADIDLGSYSNWTPIGSSTANFTGTLSGNGYTIENLTINSLSTDGVGLFGHIGAAGIVRNLKLVVSISAGNAGGIAGVSSGTITDCEVSGTIGKSNADYIGGIVAKQNGGNISGNVNNAIVVGSNYVGGVAGAITLANDGNKTVEKLVNNGTISGFGNIGGIFGSLSIQSGAQNRNSVLKECENNATVTGTGNSIGGIAGSASGKYEYRSYNSYYHVLTVIACVNNSEIMGSNMVGGVIGQAPEHLSSIQNCLNSADIKGSDYVGGILGRGDGVALSGYINDNTISGRAYVGGVAGRSGDISNSENNGIITASGSIVESSTARAYLGGLAGYCTSLSNSKNTIEISYSGTGSYVGGLAGVVGGSAINCINEANITSSGNDVGGIAGLVSFANDSDKKVENCENNGAINGTYSIGGIAGAIAIGNTVQNRNSNVTGCINRGLVEGSGDSVGGIVGYTSGRYEYRSYSNYYHRITYASCSNSADIKGLSNVGGILGNAPEYISGLSSSENTANIIAIQDYAGSYAGRAEGTAFTGLINNNTISGRAYVGGIAGAGGSFSNCSNNGAVNASGDYVGGIAGKSTSSISNCVNNIDIIALSSNNVGGITGSAVFANDSGKKIQSCTNNAAVKGIGNIGGIIGSVTIGSTVQNQNSEILSCENNGLITGTGNNIGGIAGYAEGKHEYRSYSNYYHKITFNSCENKANVVGNNNIGGILGSKGDQINTSTNCVNSVGLEGLTAIGGSNKYDIMP